jgi:hypothetical protein
MAFKKKIEKKSSSPFSSGMIEEKIFEGGNPDTELIAEPVEKKKEEKEIPPPSESTLPIPPRPVEERAPKLLKEFLLEGIPENQLMRNRRILGKILDPPDSVNEGVLKCILYVLLKIYNKLEKGK